MAKTKKIPFVNLKKGYLARKKAIDRVIKKVVKSGTYILGEEVFLLEKEFANYIGTSFGVGVASGTDALTLSLKALGIGQGDEVIIPANSYPTAFGVAATGARIVLVDVDTKTQTIDVSLVEKALTKKTKAIIPVHLYGHMADIERVSAIAKKHKLFVIEDAAQAHGASYNGKRAGSIGDIGCFSFFPTKNLGGIGDGGMVVTSNKKWAKSVRELRAYGEVKRYHSTRFSTHSRLDQIQAAFLRVQLKTLDQKNKKRKKVAKLYRQFLEKTTVVLPTELGRDHVYHLFVIQVAKRDQVQKYLAKHGVETLIHYPIPIHFVSSFSYLGYKKGDFPCTEKLAKTILSLPCYPELDEKDIKTISTLVKRALA